MTLRLLLSVPGGGHALPDGSVPDPGGWNRILIQVPDLEAAVEALRARGIRFISVRYIVTDIEQILIEDPAGNPVELFEPIRPEARLSHPSTSREGNAL